MRDLPSQDILIPDPYSRYAASTYLHVIPAVASLPGYQGVKISARPWVHRAIDHILPYLMGEGESNSFKITEVITPC